MELDHLPGGELVEAGLMDLAASRETVEALVVSIGASRLRACGIEVPRTLPDAEHRLYARLAQDGEDEAHSRYNPLLRRLVSFESALECVG
jgi:hypothetical protein